MIQKSKAIIDSTLATNPVSVLVIVMSSNGIGGNRKLFLTIDERGSKLVRNSVFDCHFSPVGRQMGIENYVSNYFDLRLSIVHVFTFSTAAYLVWSFSLFLCLYQNCEVTVSNYFHSGLG